SSGGVSPYSVTVTWGDGTTSNFSASQGAISASHKYDNDGSYTVTVKVSDSTGASATSSLSVTVKNVAPTVTITSPTAGSLFKAGTSVSLSASLRRAASA